MAYVYISTVYRGQHDKLTVTGQRKLPLEEYVKEFEVGPRNLAVLKRKRLAELPQFHS